MKRNILLISFTVWCLSLSAQEVVQMDKQLFLEKVYNYEVTPTPAYRGDKPAVIDLYADWCGPCRRVAPILQELAKRYAGKVNFYKVNVDQEKELAAYFRVSSIPLVLFIPLDGEPQSILGLSPQSKYVQFIEDYLLKQD